MVDFNRACTGHIAPHDPMTILNDSSRYLLGRFENHELFPARQGHHRVGRLLEKLDEIRIYCQIAAVEAC